MTCSFDLYDARPAGVILHGAHAARPRKKDRGSSSCSRAPQGGLPTRSRGDPRRSRGTPRGEFAQKFPVPERRAQHAVNALHPPGRSRAGRQEIRAGRAVFETQMLRAGATAPDGTAPATAPMAVSRVWSALVVSEVHGLLRVERDPGAVRLGLRVLAEVALALARARGVPGRDGGEHHHHMAVAASAPEDAAALAADHLGPGADREGFPARPVVELRRRARVAVLDGQGATLTSNLAAGKEPADTLHPPDVQLQVRPLGGQRVEAPFGAPGQKGRHTLTLLRLAVSVKVINIPLAPIEHARALCSASG